MLACGVPSVNSVCTKPLRTYRTPARSGAQGWLLLLMGRWSRAALSGHTLVCLAAEQDAGNPAASAVPH